MDDGKTAMRVSTKVGGLHGWRKDGDENAVRQCGGGPSVWRWTEKLFGVQAASSSPHPHTSPAVWTKGAWVSRLEKR
jgi:hypothetical protein